MSDNHQATQPQSDLLIYQNTEGKIKVDARLEEETVWLTQAQMAQLFGKGRSTIAEHIQNVFAEAELDEKVVCREFRQTTQHGAIIGKIQENWVKSVQGTQEKIASLNELERDINLWGKP
jgi:hypothetical protein